MRLVWVIACVTVLSACSSDPIGRIQPRVTSGDDEDDGSSTPKAGGKGSAGDDNGAAADDTSTGSTPTPTPSPPSPGGDAGSAPAPSTTPTSPQPPAPKPAPAGPVGATCQAGDAPEIQGALTKFTKAACGELKDPGDEDEFAFEISPARTFTFRIGAEADAVARITTPGGSTATVSVGATATVSAGAGTFLVRVRSRTGTVQDYRIVVE